MDQLANDYPDRILSPREAPCLSLYQPTHRSHPDNVQDPIRFRNLVDDLARSLQQRYADHDSESLLKPMRELADDAPFWNKTFDGLAVLAAPGFFRVYKLQRPVPEFAGVGDSFHTKPLLRIMQSADSFQVLGLNRTRARLFEGNRDHLDEVDLASEIPRTIEDFRDADFERDRAIRTHGPIRDDSMGRHGSSDTKQDTIHADTEQFFRSVDRGILVHHSGAAGMPLLLAALPEHHHLFHDVSRNPHLLDAAIDVYPDDLTLDELRQRAWQALQPYYLARLAGLIDRFHEMRSRELATADLADAARAAIAGRVETLLLDADREIPGRMDPTSGAITLDKSLDPHIDDLLDDLGERVLANGGEVVVVPSGRMPTDSGLAAIYRF